MTSNDGAVTNTSTVRQALFDFKRADDLDVHHNVHAVFNRLANGLKRRSVVIADILGIFQQRVVRNQLFKARAGNKVIALAVDLAGSDRARGC